MIVDVKELAEDIIELIENNDELRKKFNEALAIPVNPTSLDSMYFGKQ